MKQILIKEHNGVPNSTCHNSSLSGSNYRPSIEIEHQVIMTRCSKQI